MNSVMGATKTPAAKADQVPARFRAKPSVRPAVAKVQIPELYSRPAGGRDLQGCMKARA